MARAVRTRQRPLAEDVAVPYGALVLRLTAEDIAPDRRDGHAAGPAPTTRGAGWSSRRWPSCSPSGPGRPSSVSEWVRPPAVTAFPGYDEDPARADRRASSTSRTSRARSAGCPSSPRRSTGCGPGSRPHELLHDLFGAPPLIAAAARGILTPEEQALLRRPRSSSFDEVAWTPADAALVDEARHLLGPRNGSGEDGGAQVRPHRRRRGPGPLADAAADADPPLAVGLDDRGR